MPAAGFCLPSRCKLNHPRSPCPLLGGFVREFFIFKFLQAYQITACFLIHEQFAVLRLALHTLQCMSKTSLLPCLLQGGARLAEGLCRALGISQAVLVGHSAGALTAMEVFKRCRAVLSEQMRESCGASVLQPCTERPGMISILN